MGEKEYKLFENEDVAEFITQVNAEGISSIYEAILKASDPEEQFMEAPEAAQALAAIEYIAAAKGNPSSDFPDEAREWIKDKNVSDILSEEDEQVHKNNYDVIDISLAALENIRRRSELNVLWEESVNKEAWLASLQDLEKRVRK